MRPRRRKPDPKKQAELLAEIRARRAQRDGGYREQALKLFPHVCAICGRADEGANLRQLTVHHKDHNHMNNPPDGSNWELLCVYCHDQEHQDDTQRDHYNRDPLKRDAAEGLGFEAFEGLKDMLNDNQEK